MAEYGYTNGSFDICGECGALYGTPKAVMGSWQGTCDICGKTTGIANAKHDYALSDAEVENIIEDWEPTHAA